MLQQDTQIKSATQTTPPETAIRGDDSIYPFAFYRIEVILDSLHLTKHEADILPSVLKKLNGIKQTSAKDITDAFVQASTELGSDDETNAYVDYHREDETNLEKQTEATNRLDRLVHHDLTIVNENVSKDSRVFSTQRDLTAGAISKTIGLTMIPEHIAKARLRSDIHWHDLDYALLSPLTDYCSIGLEEMLSHGFTIGNANIGSPHSIETATAQMSQVTANATSSQYDGCSADRVDGVLAPYTEKSYRESTNEAREFFDDEEKIKAFIVKRTKKDIYDAIQALEYEINTLFSSQGQTPFTTLGSRLGTSWTEREAQEAVLKIRIEGLGKDKRTAISSKLVLTLREGLNSHSGDPNCDIKELALKCSTKQVYPDTISYDMIKRITDSFRAPMGRRPLLQGWKDPETGKEVDPGRMNLDVTTLNLPRIAVESKGDGDSFWRISREKAQMAYGALQIKAKRCTEAIPDNAPILYEYGAFNKRLDAEDNVNNPFKNGRCTVFLGYIGLYEVDTIPYGLNWKHNEETYQFTISTVKEPHDYCAKWEREDPNRYHYGIYSTPGENLTDRFCCLDTKKFGKMKDITGREYYTNSFHCDVREYPIPFEKLAFEAPYPFYAAGGFIYYCEYSSLRQNPEALEVAWDWAYGKVGYLGANALISQRYKCGFKGEFKAAAKEFECLQCGDHGPETCDCVEHTYDYLGNPLKRPMVHGRHEGTIHHVKHSNSEMEEGMAKNEVRKSDEY